MMVVIGNWQGFKRRRSESIHTFAIVTMKPWKPRQDSWLLVQGWDRVPAKYKS
jgi:hypothetical protein